MTNDQIKIKLLECTKHNFTIYDIPDLFCDMIRTTGISFEGADELLDGFITSYENQFSQTREDLEEEIDGLENRCGDYNDTVEKLEEEVEELEGKIEELKEEIMELQNYKEK